ncbi:MAG: hypothetical protein M3P92_03965, partial [Actinomycetota bacterium]|nr:hypothetical protein [Actinomycetota bacterium]
TQHYCRSTPLCPRCGTKAHGEGGRDGEVQCPTQSNEIPLRCPVCGGRHPAWSKECPEKTKVLAKAREAYQFRPRTYEAAPNLLSGTVANATAPTSFNFTDGQEDDDGYQVVGRKRLRGRPTSAAAAQHQATRDPQQTRINFEPSRVRFTNPSTTDANSTALLEQSSEPATESTPAPNTASTALATSTLDGEDTVMDSITVREDEV